MRIAVTVDTEADGQWGHGRPLTTENVSWWAPFQELCARHGAPPTYLVTSEIVADERAVAFLAPLAGRGAAEVGAHLHPWTTPPFSDAPGLAWNDAAHAYPCHLERGAARGQAARPDGRDHRRPSAPRRRRSAPGASASTPPARACSPSSATWSTRR